MTNKKISPFKLCVLQNFPFIEQDFDALTNYELLCKVVEYLNKVIDNENLLTNKVNELDNSFIVLKNYVDNYFKNLDVQDEINNKLDEMVQDGTLQEIITAYLNSKALFCFNSVSDMQNATNFIDGSYARTLGFYSYNDGGSSTYKIRTKTDDDVIDNITIVSLNNDELVAELILNSIMYAEQFGAIGNGTNDDSSAINLALSKASTIYLQAKTYKIADTIILNSNNKLFGNNTIISKETNNPIIRGNNVDNVLVKDLTINGLISSSNQNGVGLYNSTNSIIENVTVNNVSGDGIYLTECENVIVDNVKILNANLISCFAYNGNNITFKNLYIKDNHFKYTCQFKSCINSTMQNIIVENGAENSIFCSRENIQDNPDSIIPKNNVLDNIKVINHGKNWNLSSSGTFYAVYVEGENTIVNNIIVNNSYTGAIKTSLENGTINNILVDGYAKDGTNKNAVNLAGTHCNVKNISIKNGLQNALRTFMENSTIDGIDIVDCASGTNAQYYSIDKNSIITNISLTAKNVDCRGIGFILSGESASNNIYKNFRRYKEESYTQYDLTGGFPEDITIESDYTVKFQANRSAITKPFKYVKNELTVYDINTATELSSVSNWQAGDKRIYDNVIKFSKNCEGQIYNGISWVDYNKFE